MKIEEVKERIEIHEEYFSAREALREVLESGVEDADEDHIRLSSCLHVESMNLDELGIFKQMLGEKDKTSVNVPISKKLLFDIGNMLLSHLDAEIAQIEIELEAIGIEV